MYISYMFVVKRCLYYTWAYRCIIHLYTFKAARRRAWGGRPPRGLSGQGRPRGLWGGPPLYLDIYYMYHFAVMMR